jgi:hypothetical protein
MRVADEEITCAACGVVFVFRLGEAEWYAAKGLVPPRRCETCRAAGVRLTSRELRCTDCNAMFVFSIGAQQFFSARQWPDPKRCRACQNLAREKGPLASGEARRALLNRR